MSFTVNATSAGAIDCITITTRKWIAVYNKIINLCHTVAQETRACRVCDTLALQRSLNMV